MKVYVVWSGMLYDGCRIVEGIYFDEMKAQRWADMCFGTVEAVETSDNP